MGKISLPPHQYFQKYPSSLVNCVPVQAIECQIRWQAVDPALRLPPVDLGAQSLAGAEDSELARRLRGPAVATGKRLSFMNEYLAEDRDPVRCWVVVAAVAFVTLIGNPPLISHPPRIFSALCASDALTTPQRAVLGVGSVDDTPVELPKKLYIGLPSAKTIQLPDGRHLAYKEQGVTADRARFSLIAPHSFLSSRNPRNQTIPPGGIWGTTCDH
uniref:Uncharacterized protein n=1 Tax=Oryza barthii TaxID=65489 RepID=A0A0D3HSL4_9ORYZ